MEPLDLLAPDGLDPELGRQLAGLDSATAKWRQEIEELPDEAITWQPFPNGHSIGAVLFHLADCEGYWIQEVAAGRPLTQDEMDRFLSEATDQYDVRWPTPPAEPLAWYYDQLDEVRAHTHATVRELADPTRVGRSRSGREMTLRWILHHLTCHESYHGGQMVLLSLLHAAAKP